MRLNFSAVPEERIIDGIQHIGEAAREIAEALEGVAPLESCGTLDEAVRRAAARACPGETVLLSPACASFDQFRDYAHRGDEFARLASEAAGGA